MRVKDITGNQMSVSDTKVIQMGQIPQAPENAGGKECDFVFRQSSEKKNDSYKSVSFHAEKYDSGAR